MTKKTKRFLVSVSDEQRDLLEKAAKAHGLPIATWVRVEALKAARIATQNERTK